MTNADLSPLDVVSAYEVTRPTRISHSVIKALGDELRAGEVPSTGLVRCAAQVTLQSAKADRQNPVIREALAEEEKDFVDPPHRYTFRFEAAEMLRLLMQAGDATSAELVRAIVAFWTDSPRSHVEEFVAHRDLVAA